MADERCPECRSSLPDDPRFTPWCEHCDWNVEPDPPPAPRGRIARWRAARSDRVARRAHEDVLRHGPDTGRALRVAAVVASLPVHLVTIGMAVAAWRLAFSAYFAPLRVLLVVVLAGIPIAVFPRLGRLPEGAGVLRSDDAPATWDVVRRVAEALGTSPPDVIVVDEDHNAGLAEVGWRRHCVLVIGAPLWNALTPQQKLAMLGHELGHRVNQDVRRSLPVAAATNTLRRWALLLVPSHSDQGDGGAYVEVSGVLAIASALNTMLQNVLFAVVWTLGSAMESLADRAGQNAEYRADRSAAAVAGTDAAVALLRAVELRRLHLSALATAVNRRDPDVWAAQRTYLAEVPAREVTRAERVARRRLQRADASHPPTPWRIDALTAAPHAVPSVDVPRSTLRAMDAEVLTMMRADRPEVGVRRRPLAEVAASLQP